MQQFYGMNIVVEAFNRHTCTQIICADVIVCAAVRGNFRVENMEATLYRPTDYRRCREGFDVLHIFCDLTDKGRFV